MDEKDIMDKTLYPNELAKKNLRYVVEVIKREKIRRKKIDNEQQDNSNKEE